ncbi:MAG: class B sortase [Oscillospiraceae bacterium]|nr:class B sortase [Oscillospiraceae bacterium]
MKRKVPLILLCLAFLGIAMYFGLQFYREQNEYRKGTETYEELAQYVHIGEASDSDMKTAEADKAPVSAEKTDDTVWPVVDFEKLQAINPDIVAWIFIEGTNINYPVVQADDNSRYLNRLFDGTVNSAGTIFMDYRNEAELSDRNTVLYGHNMKNGTMFHQVTDYMDQEFFNEHPVCLIVTPEGNYKLEFFAGYVTNMNSDAWKLEFESDEEFGLWLENAVSKSTFNGNVQPTAQDRVVTFSTCTYEYNDARYVLLGVIS